jgi:uncharacterized membrane protein YdfJ with MMPL/SSD domain
MRWLPGFVLLYRLAVVLFWLVILAAGAVASGRLLRVPALGLAAVLPASSGTRRPAQSR